MTIDLIALLVLALWTIPLNHLPAIARVKTAGLQWAMSNRDEQPEVAPWINRADRAQRNHHDNLALIAAVILIAHVTGKSDDVTAIAASGITLARIAHGLFYVAGIPLARSLSYALSILGIGAIVVHLWV